MRGERKGLFFASDPLWRVWGVRQWQNPQPAGKSPQVYATEAGYLTMVRAVFINLTYTGAAVKAEPFVKVLNTSTGTHVMFIPSGVETKAAGEINLTWLPGSPGSGVFQGENATATLPDVVWEPGFKLEFDPGASEGEGAVTEAWFLTERFEIDPDHDNFYAHEMIEHLRRIERVLQHGTVGA